VTNPLNVILPDAADELMCDFNLNSGIHHRDVAVAPRPFRIAQPWMDVIAPGCVSDLSDGSSRLAWQIDFSMATVLSDIANSPQEARPSPAFNPHKASAIRGERRTSIVTARRMISGEVWKQWKLCVFDTAPTYLTVGGKPIFS
jgi:hypothetical protein